MLLSDLTVTVNLMGEQAMVRFFNRLEQISKQAAPETASHIETAVEDLLRDLAPLPPPHRFETKGPT